jgi:hypothetical protein
MMKRFLLLGALGFALLPSACGSSGPANPTEFCQQTDSIACDKAFECVPASERDQDFTNTFGASAADCKTKIQDDCAGSTCSTYNSSAAETCVNKLGPLTCADFADQSFPAECDAACS